MKDIKDGRSKYGQRNPIRLFVIKPEYPLPLDTDLYLGKVDTGALINMGYAEAKNALKSMPQKWCAFRCGSHQNDRAWYQIEHQDGISWFPGQQRGATFRWIFCLFCIRFQTRKGGASCFRQHPD